MKPKLYEYTGLIKKSIVIAAETEAEARNIVSGLDADGWQTFGETIGVSNTDLLEARPLKSKNWRDEAHVHARRTESGLPTFERA